MKHTIIILIGLILCQCTNSPKQSKIKVPIDNTFVYWEDLSLPQQESILSLKLTAKNSIKYYKGIFKISDSNYKELLDSIVNWNDNNLTFYFYIFNDICMKSDGVLSEILGNYCQKIILNNPNYVFNYFKKHNELEKKYTLLLGSELYFKQDGTSEMQYNFSELKSILDSKISKENKTILSDFYMKVEQAINDMNH